MAAMLPRFSSVKPTPALRRFSASSEQQRLIVVLDMDECLIHSSNFTRPDGDFRQYEDSRPEVVAETDAVDSFNLVMADGSSCVVHKRPGVDKFLEECASEFETCVFTAGTQQYAEPLLEQLDPKGYIQQKFYRHHCRGVPVPGTQSVQFLKDLSAVTPDMHRCVLVDNNPISFILQVYMV